MNAIKRICRALEVRVMFMVSRIVIFFNGNLEYEPFEHEYNCGRKSRRMTERGLEIFLARKTIEKWGGTTRCIEVGAVTPYYFPGEISDILDFWDKHELVNHHKDIFDFDYTGYNVISISTIEHVGRDEYAGAPKQVGNSVDALNKILNECAHCLITWPIGYNQMLDRYAAENNIEGLACYKRGKFDNDWRICLDMKKAFATEYSHLRWADAIAVIER